jgi:mannosyltransferase
LPPGRTRRRRISSVEHTSPVEDTLDSAAPVARLPRAEKRAGRARLRQERRERLVARVKEMSHTRAATIAGLGLLIIFSFALKVRGLGTDYWIDEGLSVGIGSHHFFDIPSLMRQDGSPPLYYMLLHVWMGWFGTSEWATQSLSTIFGLVTIPFAFWAGQAIGGRKVAWAGAALAAVNPFLTIHSYEARMYALMTLLSMAASLFFVLAFVNGRKAWRIPFGIVLALMLYTHNWALFFAAASVGAIAWLVWRRDPSKRRPLIRDAVVAFGVTFVLYLPWIPTLFFQVLHTGAPWARRPSPFMFIFSSSNMLGGPGEMVALILLGGAGVGALRAAGVQRALRAAEALLILALGTLFIAWFFSLISPAWADRYLAVIVGPLLLFAALTLTNAGRVGLWALVVILVLSGIPASVHPIKPGDEAEVARNLKGWMRPGDEVIVTHPERVPIMRHYLGGQYKYANLFGPVPDPQVFNWDDALKRLKRVSATKDLEPLLNAIPLHGHVMMVRPIVDEKANSWKTSWTFRVKSQARHWAHVINADPRFKALYAWPQPYAGLKVGVRGVVYEKIHN